MTFVISFQGYCHEYKNKAQVFSCVVFADMCKETEVGD